MAAGRGQGGADGVGERDAADGAGRRAEAAEPRAAPGALPEAAVGPRGPSRGRGEAARLGLGLAALKLRAGAGARGGSGARGGCALPARLHLQGGHAEGRNRGRTRTWRYTACGERRRARAFLQGAGSSQRKGWSHNLGRGGCRAFWEGGEVDHEEEWSRSWGGAFPGEGAVGGWWVELFLGGGAFPGEGAVRGGWSYSSGAGLPGRGVAALTASPAALSQTGLRD